MIQNQNPPSLVLFPNVKRIYDVDLGTRIIETPEFLSVSNDHKAETIYFQVDRYHDYMDLSNTTCVIQYVTPDGQAHVYPVPFFDVMTKRDEKKMIFPWCIDGAATRQKGSIQYSIRFYKIRDNSSDYELIYNLNTLISSSEVLHGMQVSQLSTDFDISGEGFDTLLSMIQDINRDGTYWTIIE
jgi:hypothetical protein